MSAHRYWRVRGMVNNGTPMACSELEFRTTIGGSTVCTGGSAISSSEYDFDYIDDYAFDGNRTDTHEWAATGSSPGVEWIGYDFGSGNDKDIVEVSYTARQYYGDQSPAVGALEYSDDGTTWTTKFYLGFGVFSSGEIKVRHAYSPPATGANPHLYWKIKFLSFTGGAASGREAEIHFTPGGSDVTDDMSVNPYIVTDNGHFSDWIPAKLFDNNTGTTAAITGDELYIRFFDPVTIEEFTWTCRNDGGDGYQVPLTGEVYGSNDGTTWTHAWDWTFSGWTAGETKTATNPGYVAPITRRRAIIVF